MNQQQWNEAMNRIDTDVIENYVRQKETYEAKKTQRKIWRRVGAIAACLCLVAGLALALPLLRSGSALPNVPVWENARYSAEEIAALFDAQDYFAVGTNAYHKVYVSDSRYLYISEIPDEEYIGIYKLTDAAASLSKKEFTQFLTDTLIKLFSAMDTPLPTYTIETYDGETFTTLRALDYSGRYYFNAWQSGQHNVLKVSAELDSLLTLDGEEIQIDVRMTDEEIAQSLERIKNKLYDIFGVSFTNTKIIRQFYSDSKNGTSSIYVYFYDESSHEISMDGGKMLSDYICISFDNRGKGTGDILYAKSITYDQMRVAASELYQPVAKAKRISLSDAEALLYNGYVFGGHSCPICMSMQDKVSFEGYDYVDIEYVSARQDGAVIPFYAFYKQIGVADSGILIYAKTYVPAIEVRGYAEYFENQRENHNRS